MTGGITGIITQPGVELLLKKNKKNKIKRKKKREKCLEKISG